MAKHKRKARCGGEVTLKLNDVGQLVCIDACGREVDLGQCAKLKLDKDGHAARLAFKSSCKLDPDFKKRLEAVAEKGVTVYERDDD